MHVLIKENILPDLISYLDQSGNPAIFIVADRNTFAAQGAVVEQTLRNAGYDVRTAILQGTEIAADADAVLEIMLNVDRRERCFLAVGAGTITDLTRFTSHRCRSRFLCMPTAPSVDGFTSHGAPLIVEGLKKTIYCHAPEAIFADLSTLCAAPRRMIASGFGDLLGKLVSRADWELGCVLWDEAFDEAISKRVTLAVQHCLERLEAIAAAGPTGVKTLMEGLVETGFCMRDFGNSIPASGAEHHLSHYWELTLLWNRRPAALHGLKVGLGAIIASGWYDQIRQMSVDDVRRLLEQAPQPDYEAIVKEIRQAYPFGAEDIIREQDAFIRMDKERFSELKERVLSRWDEVRRIAATVPESRKMKDWLAHVGAATSGEELNLTAEEVERGARYGHYIRNAFTVNKLRQLLKIK